MTEGRELVLTFLLVNHADQIHRYEIPAYSDPVSVQRVVEMIQSVLADVKALLDGTQPVVTIYNPPVAYRAEHVIGVKFEGAEPEEIRRQMGFVQPSS